MTTDLDGRIQDVLAEAISILFPAEFDPRELIKRHVWRDRAYVGMHDGKVVSWRGWSANLVTYDSHYRAVFVDVVDNVLPVWQRIELFGEDFALAIEGLPQLVVLFVLDFPVDSMPQIRRQGFVPRLLTRSVHACVVAGLDEFFEQPILYWAAKIVKLVLFQRVLSTHRKPIDVNELPLQNLIFKTGYLHSYIVGNGLGLVDLSEPRKAGEFGHDFHAVVTNPLRHVLTPFPIGIEVYTSSIGYHLETIPAYVDRFGLQGMIVIAKDNPFPGLKRVMTENQLPVRYAARLADFGADKITRLHHLALEQVITDLADNRDELNVLLP